MKKTPLIFYSILFMCILCLPYTVSGLTPKAGSIEQMSDAIYAGSTDNWDYILKIDSFVNNRTIYRYSSSWGVHPPEYFWENRIGDCSEMALLKAKMLNLKGIDARVVHGRTHEFLHDSVEINIGEYQETIDRKEIPDFITLGYGLYPGEFLYNW